MSCSINSTCGAHEQVHRPDVASLFWEVGRIQQVHREFVVSSKKIKTVSVFTSATKSLVVSCISETSAFLPHSRLHTFDTLLKKDSQPEAY